MVSEGDLQISLPPTAVARKFDAADHGMSHCMKAVDFIIELDDREYFIEIKDPDAPCAAKRKERDRWLNELLGGLLDNDLRTKYRDSFLYEWASGRATKPIYYLILIGASSLSDADLLTRTDSLTRNMPARGPGNKPWKKPFVAGCAVLNIAAWNRLLPDFAIRRSSS